MKERNERSPLERFLESRRIDWLYYLTPEGRDELRRRKELKAFETAQNEFLLALSAHEEAIRRLETGGQSQDLHTVHQVGNERSPDVKRQHRDLVIAATRTATGVYISFNSCYDEFDPGSLEQKRPGGPISRVSSTIFQHGLDIVYLDRNYSQVTGIVSGSKRTEKPGAANRDSGKYFDSQPIPVEGLPRQTQTLRRVTGYLNLRNSSGLQFTLT